MIRHLPISGLDPRRASCGLQKLGDAHKIVGRDSEDEDGLNLGQATNLDLGETSDRLDPAEHFLDALATTLTDGIAGMAQAARVDGGLAPFAGLGQMTVDGDVG